MESQQTKKPIDVRLIFFFSSIIRHEITCCSLFIRRSCRIFYEESNELGLISQLSFLPACIMVDWHWTPFQFSNFYLFIDCLRRNHLLFIILTMSITYFLRGIQRTWSHLPIVIPSCLCHGGFKLNAILMFNGIISKKTMIGPWSLVFHSSMIFDDAPNEIGVIASLFFIDV